MKFKDIVNESPESCPHCGGPVFSEMVMMEKKDACYYKVKASAKVWPSAYASGRLVQCRKKGAANYGNKSESIDEAGSSAQQAAIAINMQKHHKKPQNMGEDSHKPEAVRRIQKMLNQKYNANLDVDGVLGPLTLQSINKFMPGAKTALADEPSKTTAVQGKQTKDSAVAEEWSQKYKSSINCSHPKGFSQKAHCAGKKKQNESTEMEMVCETCGMCETHGDHSQNNLDEACWDTHKQVGMKKKGNRMVPDCRPKNEQQEIAMTENQDELARILELSTGVSATDLVELNEEFDLIESIIDDLADRNGVDAEAIWEDLDSLTDDELYVFAVTTPVMEDWQKANKKDRTAGMSQKAVNAYRRENPGSKLKTAVTTKPSKLKKGSKASKRRKSYCSRSRGQMKMHSISCAKTPDKAICKARRRWNC